MALRDTAVGVGPTVTFPELRVIGKKTYVCIQETGRRIPDHAPKGEEPAMPTEHTINLNYGLGSDSDMLRNSAWKAAMALG